MLSKRSFEVRRAKRAVAYHLVFVVSRTRHHALLAGCNRLLVMLRFSQIEGL